MVGVDEVRGASAAGDQAEFGGGKWLFGGAEGNEVEMIAGSREREPSDGFFG